MYIDTTNNMMGRICLNAEKADKLKTSRTITLSGDVTGSTSFDGSKDVIIISDLADTGVTDGYYGLNNNTTGSHGTTVAIPYLKIEKDGRISSATNKTFTVVDMNDKVTQTLTSSNLNYPLLLAPSGQAATTTTVSYFDSGVTLNPSTNTINANAATATKLQTARTLTIGNTGKTFDGSGNVSWTMSEIGCLPTAGGTMTGKLTSNSSIQINKTISSDYTANSPTEQPIVINGSLASGVSLTDKNAPGVGFHIGGITWGSLALTTQGFKFLNNTRDSLMNVYANLFVGSLSGNASTATALTSSAGSSTHPIYFSGGKPVQCGTSLGVNITGNAASASITNVILNDSSNWRAGLQWRNTTLESGTYLSAVARHNTGGNNSYPGSISIVPYATDTSPWSGNVGLFITKDNMFFEGKKFIDASGKVYGAVWNDYAEYRICKDAFKPGQVIYENGDDTLSISTERLQRGCSIVSDTFGFAIGETDEAKCPIAVSGRVLAYGYEPREEFKKHIGWPVCSGPNGTVSIMTEEEEEKYPSRIIGIISAVPDYETWGTGNVEVNNRVWIKVK